MRQRRRVCDFCRLRLRALEFFSGFFFGTGTRSEIGADVLPGFSSVYRGENELRAEIEKPRILWRKDERRHVGGAVFRAAHEDVRELAGGPVEADDAAVPATGIDDVRILRIGRDVAVFEAGRGKP